jgi:predicted SnoaL-like aldol condensation-catalyzing enzyme
MSRARQRPALMGVRCPSNPGWRDPTIPITVDGEIVMSDDRTAANKRLVLDFLRCVFEARNADVARDFVIENYIQHTDQLPSGLGALEAFVRNIFPDGPVPTLAELQHPPEFIVAEGDMVVLSAAVPQPDHEHPGEMSLRYVFNAFRISNGKLAEHWGSVGKVLPVAP